MRSPPEEDGAEPVPRGATVMAVVRWGLVAGSFAAAVATMPFTGGLHREREAAHSGVTYSCAMHPAIAEDHPGQCPICSMTLVPRAEASARVADVVMSAVPGLAVVDLSEERIRRAGLLTAPVRRRVLERELDLPGFVVATDLGRTEVTARVAGFVEELRANLGDRVTKGQVLAMIASPELLTAGDELRELARAFRAEGEIRGALLEAARLRLEGLGLAREDVAAIEAAPEPLVALPLRAPAAGVLTAKRALRGAAFERGDVVFEITDLTHVEVNIDAYPSELPRLGVGSKVAVTVRAHPGRTFSGRVRALAPTGEGRTWTLALRVAVTNDELLLRPGMIATVTVRGATQETLAVPADAVVDDGRHTYVIAARGDGRFEPELVEVGARTSDEVEIRGGGEPGAGRAASGHGLHEGDRVVTRGNILVEAEARLRAAATSDARDRAP